VIIGQNKSKHGNFAKMAGFYLAYIFLIIFLFIFMFQSKI